MCALSLLWYILEWHWFIFISISIYKDFVIFPFQSFVYLVSLLLFSLKFSDSLLNSYPNSVPIFMNVCICAFVLFFNYYCYYYYYYLIPITFLLNPSFFFSMEFVSFLLILYFTFLLLQLILSLRYLYLLFYIIILIIIFKVLIIIIINCLFVFFFFWFVSNTPHIYMYRKEREREREREREGVIVRDIKEILVVICCFQKIYPFVYVCWWVEMTVFSLSPYFSSTINIINFIFTIRIEEI